MHVRAHLGRLRFSCSPAIAGNGRAGRRRRPPIAEGGLCTPPEAPSAARLPSHVQPSPRVVAAATRSAVCATTAGETTEPDKGAGSRTQKVGFAHPRRHPPPPTTGSSVTCHRLSIAYCNHSFQARPICPEHTRTPVPTSVMVCTGRPHCPNHCCVANGGRVCTTGSCIRPARDTHANLLVETCPGLY